MDTTIYMPLLDEGTAVWRPIVATNLGHGRYKITGEASDGEEWEFATGTTVTVDGNGRIIAVATA
jgi:hypothetical protein